MNWIKQNKFLAGFFGVMVLVGGALGYLLFSAMGAAEEANASYTTVSGDLTNLQGQKISRIPENLTALNAQRDKAVQATKEFQALLAKSSFPIEEMTPEQFQDRLRKTRTALIEKGGATTTFPKDKFYVGFDEYEGRPPSKDAVPVLGRELKAIEWLCNDLIDAKVKEVIAIKREQLPEESGKAAKKKALMTSNGVDLEIRCSQQALGIFLNSLVDPKVPQFYVVRSLTVKNEKEKGPEVAQNAAPVGPVGVDPKQASNYLLGEELLVVSMHIEIVDFAEPTATPPK